jgi:hypothetical protein
MSIVVCVPPIVGTTQRLRVTKRRESIVNVERRVPIVMGADRCTMTDGPGTEPTQSVEEGRRSDQGWISLVYLREAHNLKREV